MLKDYKKSVIYQRGKESVVADAHSRTSMDILSHVEEGKKTLVKDAQRLSCLGGLLEDLQNCGIMVHHNVESSLWFR